MVGNLNIDGSLTVRGRNILDELNDIKQNMIRRDKGYIIQSARGGYLVDGGGWSDNFGGNWEQMYFRPSGRCINNVDGSVDKNSPPSYGSPPRQNVNTDITNKRNQVYKCNTSID